MDKMTLVVKKEFLFFDRSSIAWIKIKPGKYIARNAVSDNYVVNFPEEGYPQHDLSFGIGWFDKPELKEYFDIIESDSQKFKQFKKELEEKFECFKNEITKQFNKRF